MLYNQGAMGRGVEGWRTGADWTVGKSEYYRIKFTTKKKKEKKEKKTKKKRKDQKTYDQKEPLIYALNLTEKCLQIFMRRI